MAFAVRNSSASLSVSKENTLGRNEGMNRTAKYGNPGLGGSYTTYLPTGGIAWIIPSLPLQPGPVDGVVWRIGAAQTVQPIRCRLQQVLPVRIQVNC